VRRWSGVIVVNNEPLPWYEGMTVGDLLRAKAPSPPMVSVWVDGKLLAGKEAETFPLPDGANVRFFPVVGGG
jgi:thiamine biosynthesis protein ThiS